MPKARINGIELHYRLEGVEDAPVVVMTHSLAADLHMWDAQATELASRYSVLRIDMRGHGESDPVESPYTMEMLAGDVIGMMDHLGIAKAHYVGLSIGGMIGQALLLNHGDRFSSAVLCDTSCQVSAEGREMWQERIRNVAGMSDLSANVPTTIERWFSPGFVKRRPDLVDPVRRSIAATSVTGYAGCAAAISQLDYKDRLQNITVPTLVIVGEEDPGTTVEEARVIQSRIPGAELAIIPVARHLPNVERPEEFNRHLLDWLARH